MTGVISFALPLSVRQRQAYCVSNRCVKTIRPQKVTIQAQNEYGEEIMITAEDGLAQCFCHELEHLDGEIFLDKAIEEIDV